MCCPQQCYNYKIISSRCKKWIIDEEALERKIVSRVLLMLKIVTYESYQSSRRGRQKEVTLID